MKGLRVSAPPPCGPFTPNRAADDMMGRCEADGPRSQHSCLSSDLRAVQPQGARGGSGRVHTELKLHLNMPLLVWALFSMLKINFL